MQISIMHTRISVFLIRISYMFIAMYQNIFMVYNMYLYLYVRVRLYICRLLEPHGRGVVFVVGAQQFRLGLGPLRL